MAREGARGKTALEMQQVMHFPENDSLREQSFAEGHDIFNAKYACFVLSTANALWRKDYPLLGNFTSDTEMYYYVTAKNMDFGGATEETRKISTPGSRRRLTTR